MSDNKYDLNVMYDNQDFPSQDMEVEDHEGDVLLDQEEEQPGDSMEPLVCAEEGIFSDFSLLSSSQMVVVVNDST